MTTPMSFVPVSSVTENDNVIRGKTGGPAMSKAPKFAFQDRSNTVLKRAAGRTSTPKKALGGKGKLAPMTLWQENRDARVTDKAEKSSVAAEAGNESENKTANKGEVLQDGSRDANFMEEVESDVDVALDDLGFDETDVPAPEKLNINFDSDYDYYSSCPSPTRNQMNHSDPHGYDPYDRSFEFESPYNSDHSFLNRAISPAESLDLSTLMIDSSTGIGDLAFVDFGSP